MNKKDSYLAKKQARADIILMVDYKDIQAIETALEVLRERDEQDKKGMYVSPNKITRAINQLIWLKKSIERELEVS